jgi:hypothetical protein
MRALALSAVAAILSACALAAPGKAVGCKGPLRPANPFGSVLQDAPEAHEASSDQAQTTDLGQTAPFQSGSSVGLPLCGASWR